MESLNQWNWDIFLIKDATFEDYVGVRAFERLGNEKWQEYVNDVVNRLRIALEPDEIVLGGGNVHNLSKFPADCREGDNANAFIGGFRIWEANKITAS